MFGCCCCDSNNAAVEEGASEGGVRKPCAVKSALIACAVRPSDTGNTRPTFRPGEHELWSVDCGEGRKKEGLLPLHCLSMNALVFARLVNGGDVTAEAASSFCFHETGFSRAADGGGGEQRRSFLISLARCVLVSSFKQGQPGQRSSLSLSLPLTN